ncbi:MAG: TonB-dependent receptor [Betaproteobacteria bacterium]
MKKFKPTRLALVAAAVCAASPLWAQQAATDIGRITVEALPAGASTGLIIQEETPKARSSVSKAHLDSLNPTSNPYQAIEMLPGVDAFSHDASGMFGGGLRVRGFNSDEMGFTINGAPVNDSGNFAVYPMEYTDTDNLCEVFLTQGSTDTEAPHAGASGGNVGMVTCAPSDAYGFKFSETLGSLNLSKTFMRVDTGKFADGKAKAYFSYSKANVDKFKGPGKADRDHIDIGAEFKPSESVFLATSFLYNKALNNNYRTLTYAQIAASGNRLDYSATPQTHLTAVNGTAQTESVATDQYYAFNSNPFKNYLWTGKAEFKLDKETTLSAEPYFWYGYGTGGSQMTTLKEGASGATAVGGGLRDINGDGDTLDTIAVYRSSVTETNRPGITLKANTKWDNHNVLAGYWFERANHKQTQPATTFDNFGNSTDRWLENASNYLLLANGVAYQGRNELTISTGSSMFVQDSVNLLNDALNLQLGLRNTSINRAFDNYANAGASRGVDYSVNKTYSALLPSLGARYNLDAQRQVFFNVAANMKAPGNFSYETVLSGGSVVNGVLTGATQRDPLVDKETSTNLDIGYRFASDAWTFSGSLFAIDFQNRIATAYDPVAGVSIDNNVGSVKTQGFELETGYKLDANWSVYGSLSYTSSKMQSDMRTAANTYEATAGKQLPDTPEVMSGIRVNYTSGSWYGNWDTKFTGQSYSTLVNDQSVDARAIVNTTLGYRFADAGFFKKPSIQFNVTNLFDQQYVQISSGSGSNFTTRALGTGGSAPAYYVGAPRFAALTFRSEF